MTTWFDPCRLSLTQRAYYACGSVLACMQTEEFEMHGGTKIIVVTGLTTELDAG